MLLQGTSLWLSDGDGQGRTGEVKEEEDVEEATASAINVRLTKVVGMDLDTAEESLLLSLSQVSIPPFYTRLNCAKLLIEVEEHEVCAVQTV